MEQELSGVIACMQQLEIACGELEAKFDRQHSFVLGPLKDKIRAFFANRTLETAQDVLDFLREQQLGFRPDPKDFMMLNAKVCIDGQMTNLAGLTDELSEVLEDLIRPCE